MTEDPSVRNLNALRLGTGEFSFSPDATSWANARARGFVDFGNIDATGVKPSSEKIEHEGSYRGVRRVDKILVQKAVLEYSLTCDEWDKLKLQLALGADEATDITQSAHTYATAGTLAFTTTNAVANRWYDITYASANVLDITELSLPKAVAVSCVADPDTDVFTAAGHGMANGDAIYLTGTAVPTGLTEKKKYYIVNKADNTFQIAATVGGTAVLFTSAGTSVTFVKLYADETDYILDNKLGRVRFTTAKTADIIPIVSAPAIVDGDAGNLAGLTPLQDMVKEGYGRLVLFDDNDTNQVVYRHEGFKCQVLLDSVDEATGKDLSKIKLTVKIQDVVGDVWVRE